jgi:acyl-coenzyme A synthetase/AMP-(fatty) acid ligase
MASESLQECLLHSFLIRWENKAISFVREGMLETEISYRELNQDSNRMANTFLDLGVRKYSSISQNLSLLSLPILHFKR